MGRNPCCSKEQGLNRGAWTVVEDKILTDYIKTHGEGRWRNLPQKAGLKRCGKSCRLRWLNYLRPDIKRGNITPDEEELIIRLHKLLGNRWSLIAGRLPGRTDNEIKNYWNTNLGKKVQLHHQKNATNYSPGNNNSSKFTKMTNGTKRKTNQSSSGGSASPSNKMAAPPQVVRTKAVKCTSKVILNPQPRRVCPAADKEPTLGPSNVKGNSDISHCSNPVHMKSDHDTSSLDQDGHHVDHNISPPDFSTNLSFDDDDLCLADLLNSDHEFSDFLTNYGDGNYVLASSTKTSNKDVQSGSSSDLLFSEEMLVQDWRVQPNMPGSEFNSFTSVLLDDAQEDWLVD